MKSPQTEKKPTGIPGERYAPECASAAAAEIGKVLGAGLDIHAGAALLSGGNQLLLGLMARSQESTPEQALRISFAGSSPENAFEPDMTAGSSMIPAHTGQVVGVTGLSDVK